MAPGIAALAWNNTGSLGRTDGENDQAVLPSVPKTSWSAWNFTWRCIKGLWIMVKGRPGSGSTTVKVCCTPPDQEDQAHETFYRQTGTATFRNPWSSWGTSTTLIAHGLVQCVPAHSTGVRNKQSSRSLQTQTIL